MKRDELTSRIWRTVVFSGAMLGAPLASADKAEGKQKPPADVKVKPAPDTVESLTKRIDENVTKINGAIDAVVAAKTAAERTAAKQKLGTLQIEQAGLEAKLAKLKTSPPANPEIARLEKQLQEADAKVLGAVDAVTKAKSDAERAVAKSKLDATRKDRELAAAKLKDEQAQQARPRASKEDRPLGRGFVLS